MALLFAHCPKTHQRISTGIETDISTLGKVWSSTVVVQCPHCGDKHDIKVRDAYTDHALSDESVRGSTKL
jgi:hypothetical protein